MNAKTNSILLMNSISFPHKILDSVIGKILLATLQTIIGSVILLLTFLVRQTVDIIVLKYAIVMAVGLLAGFSARRLLTENTQLLKLLVAWIAASLSLAALFIISSGFIGINLFSPLQHSPDWRSLMELALSALTAWMALAAYRNKVHLIETLDDEPTMHAGKSVV